MNKEFKNRLMGLLKLKHSHLDPFTKTPSMSEALKCNECGKQVVKAEELYNRMREEHPEEFTYKQPEFIPSPELKKDVDMLVDRVKKDKLYKRHVNRMAYGTEEEKDKEIKKSNEGYYQRHYEEDGSIKKVNKRGTCILQPLSVMLAKKSAALKKV